MKVLLHVNYYEGAGKFEDLFRLIRMAGADGVELRATRYYDMEKASYLAMVEDLKQRNPDLELAFGYPLHFSSVSEDTQKQEFEDFVKFLDWAKAKCGTSLLNMFTDSLVNPACEYYDFDKNGSALADDLMYARHGAGLTAAGKELEARGMLGALETHNCYIHDLATSCEKLLRCVKSPAIGINYDHGNIFLNRNGESIDEVFELLKGKIYYAHLKNLLRTRDYTYMATHLEAGHIDTCKVLAKLKEELKSGIFAIEYACSGDGVIAAKRDMDYIRFLRTWLGI
jgi:sugar phosphate isomerase/epimerase